MMQWEEIEQVVNKGGVLIDVRTSVEFDRSHLIGAINIPMSLIYEISEPDYSLTKPLLVYCQSGTRSESAKHLLINRGYDVTNIGGITNYQEHIQ